MYARPSALNETLARTARLLAGGTYVFLCARERASTGRIVDVSRSAGPRGVARSHSNIRIGAATTWTDLVRADLPLPFDALRAAARQGAVHA